MTKVLIVEDHMVVAEGMASIFRSTGALDVVGIATDLDEAVQLADAHDLDVAILDIQLPYTNGMEVARAIRRRRPDVKLMFLSTYSNPEYVLQAIALGAHGYLLKHESARDVAAAVQQVAQGENAFSDEVLHIAQCMGRRVRGRKSAGVNPLTDRERDVVKALARGMSLSECAKSLDIRVGSVRETWRRAQSKMGLTSLPRRLLTCWPGEG